MNRTPPPPPLPPAHMLNQGKRLAAQVANRTVQGIESRRRDVQRIQQVAGGLWKCTFKIPQDTPGEALKAVSFGVTFAEEPHVSHSYSTPPNQKLTPGQYPIINGGVFDWKFSRQSSWGGKLYTGCTFTMVVVGPAGWQTVHNFTLEGKAEANTP